MKATSPLDHATKVRRELHAIPELGYQEEQTAIVIRRELTALGIPWQPGPSTAPTATIALLKPSSATSKTRCVALRADIDALPIEEATGLAHSSKYKGRMHACGHDGHTATLLATAAMLKDRIDALGVAVKFIFQPAEEGGGGGRRLCEAGVLDNDMRVDEIYGLHGWPQLPLGVISTRPGPLLAATDTIRVEVRGRGCHGAFPHIGADPIVAAAEIVVSLQALVGRQVDPTDSAVCTIGTFHAGTATNVIPDMAHIAGTVRTLNSTTRAMAKKLLIQRCQHIALAHGCTAEVGWDEGYPPTINDAAAAEVVATVARTSAEGKMPGVSQYLPAATPVMGGEDFSYYLEQRPGAFFFMGLKPIGQTDSPALHTDRFDFNDDALATGSTMFMGLVNAFASKK